MPETERTDSGSEMQLQGTNQYLRRKISKYEDTESSQVDKS